MTVRRVATSIRWFISVEDGATMVEYGLMLGLIAATCFAAVSLLGANLSTRITTFAADVAAAGAP